MDCTRSSWNPAAGWFTVILAASLLAACGSGTSTDPVPPTLGSIAVEPSQVQGGASSVGTVTLSGPAPSGGAVVALASSHPAATVPSSVTIPAGASSATFAVGTVPVEGAVSAVVTATYGGASRTATLLVKDPALTSLTVTPAQVEGGTGSTGTVSLSSPAPASGTVVVLAAASASVTVPATVTVLVGASVANFAIGTQPVAATAAVLLTATAGGVSQTATLTLDPPPVALAGISIDPAALEGGAPATGTVTLTRAAPAGGVTVSLSSNDAAVGVPASVLVPAGSASQAFTVTTAVVGAETLATVTATLGAASHAATVTLRAPPPAPPQLRVIVLDAATVEGGYEVGGAVQLTVVAPAGGADVSLSSTAAAAQVPVVVTVPEGASSAPFVVTTTAVVAEITASIEGSYGGAIRDATLTITPPPPPADLVSLSLAPDLLVGGGTATATVTLSNPVPPSGARVAITSPSAFVSVPAAVDVPVGSTSATFPVVTVPVGAGHQAVVTATKGELSRTATLSIRPPEPPAPCALRTSGAQWLAFSSKRGGVFQLWTMRDDGTCLSQVTESTSNDLFASWSPTAVLAYTTIRAGARQVRLHDVATGADQALDVGTLVPTSPAFSPDGRYLAFEASEPGVFDVTDIYVVEAAGGTPVKLTSGQKFNAGPAWSPDGSKIYFVSSRTGRYDVWSVPAVGGAETQVTTSSGILGRPAASPDGATLAFARAAGGGAFTQVVSFSLSARTTTVVSSLADQEPTFDRTGAHVVVTSYRPLVPLGNPELWLLQYPSGTPVRQLTFDPASDGAAAYGPFP